MGYKWEVTVWVPRRDGSDQWHNRMVYYGDSGLAAAWHFVWSFNKSGCVSMHYRGGKVAD